METESVFKTVYTQEELDVRIQEAIKRATESTKEDLYEWFATSVWEYGGGCDDGKMNFLIDLNLEKYIPAITEELTIRITWKPSEYSKDEITNNLNESLISMGAEVDDFSWND
jgi:hypothetical protein